MRYTYANALSMRNALLLQKKITGLKMEEKTLLHLLIEEYALPFTQLQCLRNGSSLSYLAQGGKEKFLYKQISAAFSETAVLSLRVMRYLGGFIRNGGSRRQNAPCPA